MPIAIETRFHGPTNTKGSRISARTTNGHKVWISADHSSGDPHRDAAIALCHKYNWTGTLCQGGTANGSVFVFVYPTDTFDVPLADGGTR